MLWVISGHFFYSHEPKGRRKEAALSVAILPPLLESALASSALGQFLPDLATHVGSLLLME